MPIFVWAAIAIAIVLLSAGAGTALWNETFASIINGPVGMIGAAGVVAVVVIAALKRSRTSEKHETIEPGDNKETDERR